jgi:hypothetical protein
MSDFYKPKDPPHLRRAKAGQQLLADRVVNEEELTSRSTILNGMDAMAAAAIRDILHHQAASVDFDLDEIVGKVGAIVASAVVSFADDLKAADESGESGADLVTQISEAIDGSLNSL